MQCFRVHVAGALCSLVLVLVVACNASTQDDPAARRASAGVGQRQNILLASFPWYGHVHPLTALGRELLRRGHRVAIALPSEYAAWANGVPLLNLGPLHSLRERETLLPLYEEQPRSSSPPSPPLHIAEEMLRISLLGAHAQEELFNFTASISSALRVPFSNAFDLFQPDLVLADVSLYLAIDLALARSIPFVLNRPCLDHPAFLSPPRYPADRTGLAVPLTLWRSGAAAAASPLLTNILARASELWSFAKHDLLGPVAVGTNGAAVSMQRHYLGYTAPVLLNTVPGLDFPRPLCPNYKYIGPLSLPPATGVDGADEHSRLDEALREWLDHADDDGGVVYVSMGTLVGLSEHQLDLVSAAASALSGEMRTLWSLAPSQRSRLSQSLYVLPQNCSREEEPLTQRVVSRARVPQPAVLAHPRVKVFLSHCGMSSVAEALDSGTPVLCLPFFGDQIDVCPRIAHAGVGICASWSSVDAISLANALASLSANTTARKRAMTLGARLRAQGGERAGADVVEHVLNFGADHLVCDVAYQPLLSLYSVELISLLIAFLAGMGSCALFGTCCCTR